MKAPRYSLGSAGDKLDPDKAALGEWGLTIGGPALTVPLPVGLVWLVVAVVR